MTIENPKRPIDDEQKDQTRFVARFPAGGELGISGLEQALEEYDQARASVEPGEQSASSNASLSEE